MKETQKSWVYWVCNPENLGFYGYETQKKLGFMGLDWVLGNIPNTYTKPQLFFGTYVWSFVIQSNFDKVNFGLWKTLEITSRHLRPS